MSPEYAILALMMVLAMYACALIIVKIVVPVTMHYIAKRKAQNPKLKLIEMEQKYLIECDHCEYKITNVEKDPNADISGYVNRPCPWCRNNLLTEKDYKQYRKVMSVVNWINRWFSWLTVFRGRGKETSIEMKVHNGVKITKEPDTFDWMHAIEEMKKGNKVTHRLFLYEEWVMLKPGDSSMVLFEDGNEMPQSEFWAQREMETWNTHWALWPVKR